MQRLLALLLLVGVPCAVSAQSSSSSDYSTKVVLESTLEKRLQGVLTELLGTDNVFVTVNLTLAAEEAGGNSEEVLPGVPIRDVSPKALRAKVSKVSAVVFVEQGLADKDMAQVREVANGILGFDEKRGDLIEVRQQRFRDRDSQKEGAFTLEKMLRPPHLWNVLWLAIALVAVLALPRGLASSLRMLAEAVKTLHDIAPAAAAADKKDELPDAGPMSAAAPPPMMEMRNGLGNGGGNGERKSNAPFGFIRESHFQHLLYLLRKSPPEIGAVVVNYLPSDMASRVLGALDPALRAEITANLGQVIELSEMNVRRIELMVSSKIDFLVGGADRLLEILEQASSEVQEQIIASIAGREPALSEQLRRQLVQITDMAELDASEIQHVMRRVPMSTLAPVLQGYLVVVGKMAEKLPQGMAQRLIQEVDLTRPLPAERRRMETRKVIDALKQLAAEGWIVLKKSAATPVAKATLKFKPAGGTAEA